jgi:RimJ/RimL family protein N-acetyltransferase
MEIVLDGPRIRLRRIRRSDAESIQRYAKDKEISRYTFIPHPYRLENAYEFIKNTHKWFRKGSTISLGMEWKETGEIIGMISLMRINLRSRNAELGYWLAKKYWGQGITLEAVRLILKYGFKELKLVRIYARVFHPNTASTRVLKKAGFTQEGYFRKAEYHHRRWMDSFSFAILKEEFKK